MNQIVYTGDNQPKIGINKIVIFFTIIIILFAVALIGQGIFFLSKTNKKNADNVKIDPPEIITNAEGNNIELKIKHVISLNKVFYSWGNGQENEIKDVEGKNEKTQTILAPNEDSTLNIRIIDQNNEEYKFSKEFKYNETVDVVKPRIDLTSIIGNVVATVTDNKEISYIEYHWNDEQPVRVQVEEQNKTKLEYKIAVKEGKNKITVVAVDASGNTATKEIETQTVTRPTIDLKKSKGEIIIKVSDEKGITKVEYEINGVKYTKEISEENKKEFEIRDLLVRGTNIIKVTAHNIDGLTAEKTGKCIY